MQRFPKILSIGMAAVLVAGIAPLAGVGASDSTKAAAATTSAETYSNASFTLDSDDFFAELSGDESASLETKIPLSSLEKFGIYVDSSAAAEAGVADAHVAVTGSGGFVSPVKSSTADGASISYTTLCTITLDDEVFAAGEKLSYTNNNGASVSYNKRDVIQAVLYAIAQTTQSAGFDGTTMYRVAVDYNGTIDLTNTLYIYSNTWLQLGKNTVMKKQFQSASVSSTLADRDEAQKRQLSCTNVKMLRDTATELGAGGYGQCDSIVIDGGAWDPNLENYNAARLGADYGCGALGFSHMKNLVVQNTAVRGANNGHHLELAAVRNATVSGCSFSQYDGADEKEAIQIEPLHSKGSTRNCAPYDDTPCRDIVICNSSFQNLSRGVGNHTNVLGLDCTRIYVYGNTFANLSGQAVLTVGCKTMLIEKNTMSNVATGVDVRVTKVNGMTNVWLPNFETWDYDTLVDAGFLNRNIKVLDNTISATGGSTVNATNCYGVAISVKGQTISAGSTETSKLVAGSYTITGVTVKGNTITSANGTGVRFYNTNGCTFSSNKVKLVNTYAGRGIGLYVKSSTGLSAKSNTFSKTGTAGVYASGASSLSVKKNTFASAGTYGVYLSGSSKTTVSSNKITVAKKKAAVYATTSSKSTTAKSNTIVMSGATALSIGRSKTPAYTSVKKTRTKISGKALKSKTVSAYANGKQIGSAKASKKGKFTIKFKKKQAKGTVVQLRYKDSAKNSIRRNVTL